MSSRLPLNRGRAMRAEGSDAQPGRDELQTRREAVLQDLQGLLDSEKARVQDELQHLMDEKWRRETEEWGAEQRRPASGAEEDQGEEEMLPSGWDSLPWSDGYRRAMARADERREERRMQLDEQGIIGDGTGMGAMRRGGQKRSGADVPYSSSTGLPEHSGHRRRDCRRTKCTPGDPAAASPGASAEAEPLIVTLKMKEEDGAAVLDAMTAATKNMISQRRSIARAAKKAKKEADHRWEQIGRSRVNIFKK